MKVNIFPSILVTIAAIAIGYLAYHLANTDSDQNSVVVAIGTFVSVLLTLGCVTGVSIENGKLNANFHAWGIVAFIVMCIVNLCYASFGVSMPYYIILITLLILIHLWVAWKIITTTGI